MNNLRISQFNDDNNFQICGVKSDMFDIKNSFVLLNNLSESLNQNLSQSVMDLVNCFICLSPATNPLSCPKCNNFACKACLETYFLGAVTKKCPLCKQDIKLVDMKENKVIDEIEGILHKDNSKKNKIEELSKLIEEKKNIWENQTNKINAIMERICKYQESLENYKKEYELFFSNCQKLVQDTFINYYQKTEELINSLFSLNNFATTSIRKLNDMNVINRDNGYFDNNNIKKLINEILSMERKHFNNKNKDEIDQFLTTPIKLYPSINQYNLLSNKIELSQLKFTYSKTIQTNHFKLGKCDLRYKYNCLNLSINCLFSFTLNHDINACFLITQNIIDFNQNQKYLPMKLISKQGRNYMYEVVIPHDIIETAQKNLNLSIDILLFSI